MILKFSTRSVALAAAMAMASSAAAQSADEAEYNANWGLAMIQADAANALGYTGAGVTVAVLDSGIDVNHPDLINSLAPFSYDMNTGGAATVDYDMHGTHVSGIIAGSRNGVGVRGVAYDAKVALIIPRAAPDDEPALDRAAATVYGRALNAGMRIFNNSWGFNYYTGTAEGQAAVGTAMTSQIAAFKRAVALDSVIVFSTGNEYETQPNTQAGLPYYLPELQANWLAVTAVQRTGLVADYANHCGLAAAWCLAAPGGDGEDMQIYSTIPLSQGGYGPSSGTSMAAPHVTGAVAVARQMFPDAKGSELARFVLVTATDIGDPGLDEVYGWGLLNMGNMAAARTGQGVGLFAAGTWAAGAGQSVLIEGLDARLKARGERGVWGAALGGWNRRDATATAGGADADSLGFVAGYDLLASDTARLGAALSWVTTDLDQPGLANSAEIDSIALSAYGAATRDRLFIEGSAGGEHRDFQFTRGSLAGASGTVLAASGARGMAETKGHGLFADGRLGLSFAAGFGEIRPFLHARLSHQTVDGFTETGADILNLTVSDLSMTRYEAGPGVEFRFRARPVGSASVSGDLAVRYDTNWGDDDYEVTALMMGSGLSSSLGAGDPVTLSGGLSADWGRFEGSLRSFYSRADDQEAGGVSLSGRLTF